MKTNEKIDMDVSKNRGTPKWMVYNLMENPIKMDDLGVPLFLETPICFDCFGDIHFTSCALLDEGSTLLDCVCINASIQL